MLKSEPPPDGGVPELFCVLHQHFEVFSFEIEALACTGCKIEGSWVLGGHSGEKLKLLSTTSKLVV